MSLDSEILDALTDLVGRRDLSQQEFNNWLGGSATGGPSGDGYYPLTDGSGFTRSVASPAKLAELAQIGGSGGLASAESLGFVQGLGSTQATSNRVAWTALMSSGGTAFFGPGDWDFRFASISQTLDADLMLRSVGPLARVWVNAATYIDLGSGALDMKGMCWYSPTRLGNSTLIGVDNQTADIDHLIVEECWFLNLFVAIRSTSTSSLASVNPYKIDQFRMNRNTVRTVAGLSRIATKRGGRVPEYLSNDIDMGPEGGLPAGYAGIYHGFVANNGLVLSPEEVGENLRVDGNTVRNAKPILNPRSAGGYSILTNVPGARITNNIVDKCYPFYGAFASTCSLTNDSNLLTAVGNISRVRVGQGVEEGVGITAGGIPTGATVTAVNVGAGTVTISAKVTRATGNNVAITFTNVTEEETMFIGNGSATTFGGTLTRYPTPDSLKIIAGGATVADDLDRGWAKGGESRQKIVSSTGILLGWIDYDTRQWSLTFPAPPANGAVYTARYFEGLAVNDVEGIYNKSHGAHITGNHLYECSGRQGSIAIKSGGQTAGVGERQAAGGYGEKVIGNTLSNRIREGIFSSACAVWAQSDAAQIKDNLIKGYTDRIVRYRPGTSGSEGRQFQFTGNIIRDFYGYRMITMVEPTQNTTIDFDIDGWFYDGSLDFVQALEIRAEDGAEHHNVLVEKVIISDRVTAGKPVVVCSVREDTTGYVDITIGRVLSRVPWRAVLKTGDGSAGRINVGPYRPTNLVESSIVTGSTVSNDKVFERSGTGITDLSAWSDQGGGGGGSVPFAQDEGGANTIILSITSPPIASLSRGQELNVLVSATSSGPVTLNINGLGANPVFANGAPLAFRGSLQAGRVYKMVFDGANWQVLNLPHVLEKLSAAHGYEVTSDGEKRCWNKLNMSANSTVTWVFPARISGGVFDFGGWVNVAAPAPIDSDFGANYALDISLGIKELNYDPVTNNLVSITYVNNTDIAIQAYVEVRGT